MTVQGHCCGLDRRPWTLNHQLCGSTEVDKVRMRSRFSEDEWQVQ